MEARPPKAKRHLARGYMEKLHTALCILIGKSNGLDVSDDQVLWARARLAQYLEEVDALFADAFNQEDGDGY